MSRLQLFIQDNCVDTWEIKLPAYKFLINFEYRVKARTKFLKRKMDELKAAHGVVDGDVDYEIIFIVNSKM